MFPARLLHPRPQSANTLGCDTSGVCAVRAVSAHLYARGVNFPSNEWEETGQAGQYSGSPRGRSVQG